MSEENKIPPEEIPQEQPLNNESADEIVSSAEPIAEDEQQPTTNNQPQTEKDMEVHHHTHASHGKKNWKDYFWEFLMLFLAVFCGFLAEYQLEHVIEHNREKQYIISLAEDLETDTAELKKAIGKCDSTALYSDSVLFFLTAYKPAQEIPVSFAAKMGLAGQRLTLINTDRTSSQLKNSGGMRLVRDKKISDEVLRYWKQIDETNITLDRYLVYRNAGREISFKLWVIPQVYSQGLLMPKDSIKTLRIIDPDKKKWDELTNLMAISGAIARTGHSGNLKRQLEMADNLIALIKKEYHLE
jgi:hypothetical protein